MAEIQIKRALLSVTDKTGLVDFASYLSENGVELISTGGTAQTIRDAGINVVEVSDFTGSPEILGGRVKTLHPKIHGGILARRDHDDDQSEMAENDIRLTFTTSKKRYVAETILRLALRISISVALR